MWLTVKVEVLLHYLLCHAPLHGGSDPVTQTVLIMSYIPIHIGREEKYSV